MTPVSLTPMFTQNHRAATDDCLEAIELRYPGILDHPEDGVAIAEALLAFFALEAAMDVNRACFELREKHTMLVRRRKEEETE